MSVIAAKARVEGPWWWAWEWPCMGWHAASGQERTLFQEVGTGDWRWDDSPSTPDPTLYFTNVTISSHRSTRSSTPGCLMSQMRSGGLLSLARAKAAGSSTLGLRAWT